MSSDSNYTSFIIEQNENLFKLLSATAQSLPDLTLTATPRLVFNSNGEFAINRTTPSTGYALDILGNVNIEGNLLYSGSMTAGIASFT